jgi:hypothetical protein
MNLRVYFRLLQPLRTVLFVLFYAAVALIVIYAFFRLGWPTETLFISGAITVPLLLGVALTSSVHAVLHRPFALLLPDVLRKMRRAAAFSYIGLALVVTLACHWIEPRAPEPALFGLALGLLTLACANRRRGFPRFGFPGTIPGTFAVAAAWLVFHLKYASTLLPSMQSTPAVFFAGGCTLTAATFGFGFSRRILRERATTPYFALNTTWASLCNQSAFRRYSKEQIQFNASRGIIAPCTGRDWPLATVGPRLRDWLRVIDQQLGVSPVRKQFTLFASMVTMIPVQIAAFGALGLFNQPQPFHLSDFFAALGGLTAPNPNGPDNFFILIIAVTIFPTATPMLHGQLISRPRLAYPLARTRLADLIFLHLSRDLLVGLLVPALAVWTSSLIGQVVSRHFHPGLGLPAVAAILLAFSPFLPFVAMNNFSHQSAAGKFASRLGLFFFVCLFFGVTLIGVTHGRALILSPAGISVSLLVTAAGLERLRRRIRRYYATCDLTDGATWAPPFGRPTAARQ